VLARIVLMGFMVVVVATGMLAQAPQGSPEPDVPELLVEVRALRAEVNRAAGASMRMQLLLARLTLQEQRITSLGRQTAEAQDDGDFPFVFERGTQSQYARTDGVHELRAGPGWLRTPRLFSDFTLAFDFRLASPDTEAAVFIRSLTGVPVSGDRWGDSVYRFHLPGDASASAELVAVRGTARVTSDGRVALRPMGEWQHVSITAAGQQVSLSLNGVLVGEFQVEHFAGHVLFEATTGVLHLTNLRITPVEPAQTLAADVSSLPRLEESGVEPPRIRREVKPFYTPDAMRRKVEGVVLLDALVLPDGSVGAARVKQSLDPDLDQSAVASLRRWQFMPATRDGIPVAVVVAVEVSFTLKR
jgi:TonB family protein